MRKKPPTARRPQEAMARFDRLLAAMAPKAEAPPKKTLPQRGTKKREISRRRIVSPQ
jgi:hypothetical protein